MHVCIDVMFWLLFMYACTMGHVHVYVYAHVYKYMICCWSVKFMHGCMKVCEYACTCIWICICYTYYVSVQNVIVTIVTLLPLNSMGPCSIITKLMNWSLREPTEGPNNWIFLGDSACAYLFCCSAERLNDDHPHWCLLIRLPTHEPYGFVQFHGGNN